MSEEIENYYGIPTEAQKPFKFANKIPTKEDLNKIVCKQVVEIVSLQQKVEKLEKEVNEYQKELEKADSITQSCIFQGKQESKMSFRNCLNKLEQLEKENEYLKMSNPEQNMEHFRIVKENERKIDNLRKQNKDLQQKVEQLENIRKKAIEYINNNNHIDGCLIKWEVADLLNILNKGSEDNV